MHTIREAGRRHVPELEQAAFNQRPKTSNYHDVKLYQYEGMNLYQWWGKYAASPFEDPVGEPFVIAAWSDAPAAAENPADDVPKSVLQDWVMRLPLRQQGVLILALRGPDGVRKESEAKPILRSLRACAMNSGREGVPMKLGQTFDGDAFMRMDLICDRQLWAATTGNFYASIDEHNVHFLQHLLHAGAVLGFNHPIPVVAQHWLDFYHRGVDKLHMKPETKEEFTYRLRNGRRFKEDEA